jgi:hypothetical protein
VTPGLSISDRYYTIQDVDDRNFRAGRTADGRQVLMSPFQTGPIALFFDDEGRLLGRERRRTTEPAPMWTGGGPSQIPGDWFERAILRRFRGWQDEIGLEPGTIRVRGFFLDEEQLGIKDMPDHFAEYLADPANFILDEEETLDWPGLIEDWRRAGRFVLWWGKDYWMEADGEIEST